LVLTQVDPRIHGRDYTPLSCSVAYFVNVRTVLQLYRFLYSILYTILYRLVFLLGETNDEKDQTKLEEEAHTYGDIVQVGA
jgi:hypothetical protein